MKSYRRKCSIRVFFVIVTIAAMLSGGLNWALDYERLIHPLLYPQPEGRVPPIF